MIPEENSGDLRLVDDSEIMDESRLAFLKFAEKYIIFDRKANVEFTDKIKEYSKLIKLPLPADYSETFLYFENAKWYWTLKTPVSNYLHRIYNYQPENLSADSVQKLIYEYYSKWAVSDSSENNDKYFALSVIKQIKDSRKNAINILLHATILTFDRILFNPAEALKLYDEAESIVESKELDFNERQEIKYVTAFFKGFVHLKMNEYDKARNYFLDALKLKENGIMAKFHLSLASLFLDNYRESGELVKEIINFDLGRLQFAIEINSLNLFEFFLENSVVRSYFVDTRCAPLETVFENRINELISSGPERFKKLKEELINVKELKMDIDKQEEIKQNLEFMSMFAKCFHNNVNLLTLEALVMVEKKFYNTIKTILSSIESKFEKEIARQVQNYEAKIRENKEIRTRLSKEIETSKNRFEEKAAIALRSFQASIEHKIKGVEDKIGNLDLRNDLNPLVTFKNSLAYSAMLAFMVLLLGGFAEYSNSYVQDIANFSRIITVVFISGSKWGVISFVVGIIVSVFISMSTSFERSKVKQKYTRYISHLRDEKESGIKRVKNDAAAAKTKMENESKKRIEMMETQNKELEAKKKADADNLREKAKNKIKPEMDKLSNILSHYDG